MGDRDLTKNSIYLASTGLFEPGRDQPNAAEMEQDAKSDREEERTS
jgi:hypothetical protein